MGYKYKIIILTDNIMIPEFIFELHRPDMSELHLLEPFEGRGMLLAHPLQVEDEEGFVQLTKQILQRAGVGLLGIMLPLPHAGLDNRIPPVVEGEAEGDVIRPELPVEPVAHSLVRS